MVTRAQKPTHILDINTNCIDLNDTAFKETYNFKSYLRTNSNCPKHILNVSRTLP